MKFGNNLAESFRKVRREVLDNLETIQARVSLCVEAGMQDPGAHYYNELVDLIAEASEAEDWALLEEVIAEAKTIEKEVDAWLSFQGQTSVSLFWPSKERKQDGGRS